MKPTKLLSLWITVLAIFSGTLLQAQMTDGRYFRSSLTYLFIDNNLPDQYREQARSAWQSINTQVSDRYDYNRLDRRFVTVADTRTDSAIASALMSEKVTNELVAYWWSRDENGNFDIETVAARGEKGATDAQVSQATSSIRGLEAVKDQGEALIDRSTIVLFEVNGIKTYQEIYDAQDQSRRNTAKKLGTDFEPVERKYRGYEARVTVRLFQLKFAGEAAAEFYSNFWVDESTSEEDRAARMAAFDEYAFPVRHIRTISKKIKSREDRNRKDRNGKPIPPTSMDVLFSRLINTSHNQAGGVLRATVGKITTSLFSVKPLTAKIGTKEDLMVDTRYFVYEYRLKANGDTAKMRKGVIRAKTVTNNRGIASGDTKPSEFYEITGLGLQPGMLLEEHDDNGAFISLYSGIGGNVRGFGIRGDLMISKFSETMKPGWFISAYFSGQSSEEFTTDDSKELSFGSFGGGVRKDIYLLSFVRAGAGLEVGSTSITDPDIPDEDDEGLDNVGSAWFITPNLELGIHVWHNIQIVGAGKFFVNINPTAGENYVGIVSAEEVFKQYRGLNLNLGVRANF